MTPEQLAAATTWSERCYVKAGPGSGKTYLATEAFGFLRYVRYLNDPRGVLGVTFARSARSELEGRVTRRWGARAVGWPNGICTFDELHRRLLRYLVFHGHLTWPSGSFPAKVDDSWRDHPGATGSPGKKARYMLTLDDHGAIIAAPTMSDRVAPKPCFTDGQRLLSTARDGYCTHAEVRSVLSEAMHSHAALNDAVRRCLGQSYCHLIVDESFDMNVLDGLVVERAIEAGVGVTLVGDPWQSLYEFRGASPERVHELLARHEFHQIDMPGARRYITDEMRDLAQRLFDEAPFAVVRARVGDKFDVVLAHDWNTLWEETRIGVLPMGRPSGLDGSELANCFVLLLNEVVRSYFGRDAAGVVEARRKLGIETYEGRIDAALAALRDPAVPVEKVWHELEREFRPTDKKWSKRGKRADVYMARLRDLCVDDGVPILGLTIHQAKGLEWNAVLLLNTELTTSPEFLNRLDQTSEDHRSVYVGLTRARSLLRVVDVRTNKYTPKTQIAWVPIEA